MSDFDSSTPGGRDLNADLAVLRRKFGCGEILMEALFPGSRYPQEPPLLRVVRPRIAWYTGVPRTWPPTGHHLCGCA